MMQLNRLIRNIKMNLSGWHTDRKLVVIESDDWGSVCMPSKRVYDKLLSESLRVDKNAYCRYDSLATPEDLESLFDVLSSVKDFHGNSAVITANTVVANPDFDAIRAANFEQYYYEPFTETLKRSDNTERSYELWKQGMSAGIFRPQFHGREHLYVKKWMNDLRLGHKAAMKGFEYGTFGFSSDVDSSIKVDYMGAFNSDLPEDIADFSIILKDGLSLFKELFGYGSRSFIATKYTWPESIEPTLIQNGVLFLQGLVNQYIPVDDDTNFVWKNDNYTGGKSNSGLTYITRNAFFEPSVYAKKDQVGSCMRRIDIAFKSRKPVVISAHRLNFIGSIDVKNRERNLAKFSELLKDIVKRYPDMEFVSTDQLGDIILNSKTEIKNTKVMAKELSFVDKKRRVLFLMPSMGKGGVEKVLINLLNVIDRKKFEIDLCVVKGSGVYMEQVPTDINLIVLVKSMSLGRVYTFLHKKFNVQFFYRFLVNSMLRKKYDVAVSFSDSSYTELLTYMPKKPDRLICWVHASYASNPNYMKYYTPKYIARVLKNRYSKMDTIVFGSSDAMKDSVSIFGNLKDMRVIYNVLDVNGIIEYSNDVDAVVPGLKMGKVSIVAMGSLFPVKGYDMLIEACSLLRDDGLNFHLTILGDGYLRQKLERLVSESDLNDFVTFAGFVKNPYASVAAADIYVMSSYSEGLPTALCEAMVLGKPVVATECDGCNEVLKQGRYGVQVEKNSGSMASGLRFLITDENQRQIYSKLSLERAGDFRDEEVLRKIEDLLCESVQTDNFKLL